MTLLPRFSLIPLSFISLSSLQTGSPLLTTAGCREPPSESSVLVRELGGDLDLATFGNPEGEGDGCGREKEVDGWEHGSDGRKLAASSARTRWQPWIPSALLAAAAAASGNLLGTHTATWMGWLCRHLWHCRWQAVGLHLSCPGESLPLIQTAVSEDHCRCCHPPSCGPRWPREQRLLDFLCGVPQHHLKLLQYTVANSVLGKIPRCCLQR